MQDRVCKTKLAMQIQQAPLCPAAGGLSFPQGIKMNCQWAAAHKTCLECSPYKVTSRRTGKSPILYTHAMQIALSQLMPAALQQARCTKSEVGSWSKADKSMQKWWPRRLCTTHAAWRARMPHGRRVCQCKQLHRAQQGIPFAQAHCTMPPHLNIPHSRGAPLLDSGDSRPQKADTSGPSKQYNMHGVQQQYKLHGILCAASAHT